MALTTTNRVMRGTDTAHMARLTQSQAEAAMEIAEAVGRIPADCDPEVYDDKFWARVDAWAAELGMSGPDAVARASEPPEAAETEAGR